MILDEKQKYIVYHLLLWAEIHIKLNLYRRSQHIKVKGL